MTKDFTISKTENSVYIRFSQTGTSTKIIDKNNEEVVKSYKTSKSVVQELLEPGDYMIETNGRIEKCETQMSMSYLMYPFDIKSIIEKPEPVFFIKRNSFSIEQLENLAKHRMLDLEEFKKALIRYKTQEVSAQRKTAYSDEDLLYAALGIYPKAKVDKIKAAAEKFSQEVTEFEKSIADMEKIDVMANFFFKS